MIYDVTNVDRWRNYQDWKPTNQREYAFLPFDGFMIARELQLSALCPIIIDADLDCPDDYRAN